MFFKEWRQERARRKQEKELVESTKRAKEQSTIVWKELEYTDLKPGDHIRAFTYLSTENLVKHSNELKGLTIALYFMTGALFLLGIQEAIRLW